METTKTNQLIYKTVKTNKGLDYHITIKLADECKNGHNDFSMTGYIYEHGYKSDSKCHGGGAIGEKIAEICPEFRIFDNLHLCDVNGAPLYAIENGFYFIKNQPEHVKSHFRVTDKEAAILLTAEDREVLAYMLINMGIVKRWKDEAKQAIKQLEELTGQKFEDNSKKIQRIGLTPDKKQEIQSRIDNGFYTPVSIEERKMQKRNEEKVAKLDEILKEYQQEEKKAKDEYLTKKAILEAGLSIENFIYYNHKNEGVFNWKDYGPKVTQAEFDGFLDYIKLVKPELPKNVEFSITKK